MHTAQKRTLTHINNVFCCRSVFATFFILDNSYRAHYVFISIPHNRSSIYMQKKHKQTLTIVSDNDVATHFNELAIFFSPPILQLLKFNAHTKSINDKQSFKQKWKMEIKTKDQHAHVCMHAPKNKCCCHFVNAQQLKYNRQERKKSHSRYTYTININNCL